MTAASKGGNASGAQPAVAELAESACATLSAALDALSATPSGFRVGQASEEGPSPPTREAFVAAAEAIKLEASKAGLLWGGGDGAAAAALPPEEASAMLDGLQQRVLGFCALCAHCCAGAPGAAAGGPTLCGRLQAFAAGVVGAVSTLVRQSLIERCAPARVPQLVGVVWQKCDGAKKVPIDDRTALQSSFVKVSALLMGF